MKRLGGSFFLLPLAGVVVATGQEAPRFPAAATVVTVDVRVVAQDGAPVKDLRPDDFKVELAGKPRPVAFAEYRDLGGPGTGPLPSVRRFSSNATAAPGRLVVIAVDRDHLSGGGARAVLTSAGRLLDELTPADRVILATLPQGTGLGPTPEFARVRDALQRIVGTIPTGRNRLGVGEALAITDNEGEVAREVMGRECAFLRGRARDQCVAEVQGDAKLVANDSRQSSTRAVFGLRSLVDRVGVWPGAKTMLLLSEGFVVQDQNELDLLAAAVEAAQVDLVVMLLQGMPPDAATGQVIPSARFDERLHAAGLEKLVTVTGGAIFRVGGSGEGVFERVARETSGRYLLGLDLPDADADGKSHTLRVQVSRPDVRVRAPRSVRLPRSPLVPPKDEDVLAAALRLPSPLLGLPVRVATFTVRDPQKPQVRVLISAEIGRSTARPQGVSVAFLLRDGNGQAVTSGMESLQDARAEGPVRFVGAAVVAPGTYTLKLAALDRRGRRGSVEHPVQASLTEAGEVTLSDLILSDAAAQGTLRPDVDVEIAKGGLLAYLEVYARDPSLLPQTSVTVELAPGEDSPFVMRVPMQMVRTSESDRRVAQGTLPIDGLPPGDYVARAVVLLSGRPVRHLVQPVRVVE